MKLVRTVLFSTKRIRRRVLAFAISPGGTLHTTCNFNKATRPPSPVRLQHNKNDDDDDDNDDDDDDDDDDGRRSTIKRKLK